MRSKEIIELAYRNARETTSAIEAKRTRKGNIPENTQTNPEQSLDP
jgi:hypothetical protein